ncbi:MAG: RNA methyltransferase, partial [Myxococcales bacterium]
LDVDARRLGDLAPRLARNGVTIVSAALHDGRTPPEADRVLVDAPCSSLGTLRRSPDARWRLTPAGVTDFPALQREILLRASAAVRPGGTLLYATCALNRAENEEVAEAFARACPGFAPAPLAHGLGEPLAAALGAGATLTLAPHRHGTDGFFLAAFRRG